MRRERVEYLKDLPLNIELLRVKEYPLHWQNSLEILFMLKGSIMLNVEAERYPLKETEIEIINPDEVYSMEAIDEDNLLLIFQIDPMFFESYYEDAKDIFYYTDSANLGDQDKEKYYKLKKLLAIILYEVISKLDDYEDIVEEKLLDVMYHLLNNFHYLFYDEESLKDDEIQLERYHRIMKYLSNNYMNKVSLKDIAKQEFLSSQYLSYKIKEVFGKGFNEYLNQIRVEESTKLLLDTNKSISEIAEDVGFSHVRYYNKHFKNHYNMTPLQYRKKYKVSDKELEKLKRVENINLLEAINYLESYLFDYERYNYDNRIIKLDIDLKKEPIDSFKKPEIIDIGDVSLLLEEENRRILKEIQEEIGFKYLIVNNLFSDDMDIYKGKNKRFINWTRVEIILDFLEDIKLIPIISTNGVQKHIVDDFINTFSKTYSNLEKYLELSLDDFNITYPLFDINTKHDTLLMANYIIYSYTIENRKIVMNVIDEISKDTVLTNETFFGGKGLFTANYLNKPSFYAFKFLSLLGDEVLYKDEGHIITRSESGYQILLYNPEKISEEEIYGDDVNKKLKEKKISLNFFNTEHNFQITKYDLNKSHGSVYDKWIYLGSPERLTSENWSLLDNYVHPYVSFYFSEKTSVFNLVAKIKPNGCVLFTFNYGLN
ncbi:MAG: helix-turn-helix domain-containing protein [Tissierellales bacterium]|nr:helix-turn-helix domain-containing protein [Tissierellales bacterium]